VPETLTALIPLARRLDVADRGLVADAAPGQSFTLAGLAAVSPDLAA
jgi:hypothetical protein